MTIERAVPILPVRDLDDDLALYTRLGFAELARYPGYVLLTRGECELHLAEFADHDPHTSGRSMYLQGRRRPDRLRRSPRAARPGWLPVPGAGIGPHTQALTTELRARIAAGLPTVRLNEIEDKPWGQREFTVIDLSGNAVRIGSPLH